MKLSHRLIASALLLFSAISIISQDSLDDDSIVSEDSKPLKHLLSLFTIHGSPLNQNTDNRVTILINHGYALGFSSKYNQPLWAAYQVSRAKQAVDYERFPFFVDDTRLPLENQIGTETFGGGYDLGHMAPNAAINKQYSKLSQMETFFMSNISPQKGDLNRGVWQRLEAAILNTYPLAGTTQNPKKHIWVIVGPIISDAPSFITRPNGSKVAIPDSFFCILARPKRYPYDSPGNADYLAFVFPQDVPLSQPIAAKFLKSIDEVEALAGLSFFPKLTETMQENIEANKASALW